MKEIQDKTTAETTRLSGEIAARLKVLDEKLASTLSAHKTALEQLVETKAKDVADNLTAQISSVNSKLDGTAASLRTDLREADYKFASMEAEYHLNQGVYNNTLRAFLEKLDISIRREWTWRVANDLDAMQNLLKRILDENSSKPDAELIRQVNVALSKVPKEFAATIAAIRSLVEKLAS